MTWALVAAPAEQRSVCARVVVATVAEESCALV